MAISPQGALSVFSRLWVWVASGLVFPHSEPTSSMIAENKELYYNWYYFAVNGGGFFSSTIMVWLQDNCGWVFGFGVLAIGILRFLATANVYRY